MPETSFDEMMETHRPYLKALDRESRGLGRYELTSFFATPGAFDAFLDDLQAHFAAKMDGIDAIVGLDALGFVVAGGLGARTHKPVILARKGDKIPLLPDDKLSTGAFADYMVTKGIGGAKSLEIRKDLVKPGMKVLVMDEWIDTGGQMTAIVKLLETAGAQVLGIGTLHIPEGRSELGDQLWENYDVFAANRSPPTGRP